jgi:hypothetical protein
VWCGVVDFFCWTSIKNKRRLETKVQKTLTIIVTKYLDFIFLLFGVLGGCLIEIL